MADKIQVAVRVRPVLFQKKDVEVHWGCEQGMVVQLDPTTKKRIGHPYLFDQVFSTETQNFQIFNQVVQPLINSAMDGFNVTVLAYGQTASGKTYTMMGSQKELGIVQLAVNRIFTIIEKNPERAFLLRCSYIEIYNESISDLLSANHQKLKVQELAEGHVIVHNLIETNVNTPEAVIQLMQLGNKHRKVGGTSMNERSSRSHTIFRIIVESVPRAEADRTDAAVMVSHINLVDLAGSEKASQTNATGDRFREGCAINTSLSALSLVIKQLSEGEGFVNFRDSKLTHILRASLGGNARTAIICNVTPTVLEETSSTLKFASSAKTVQNQPHVNEVLSDQALLRKYNNYIKDLEKKLKEKELEQKPEAIEEMQRLLQEKDMKINELKEQLVVSSCSQAAVPRPDDLSSLHRSLRRMTWGGNRLKQNFPGVFENTPLLVRSGSDRQRVSTSNSEMALDEITGDTDSIDSEIFVPADQVFFNPSESSAVTTKCDVATMTDCLAPLESPFRRPNTPSTPAPVLRDRLTTLRRTLSEKEQENEDLRGELEDLTSFTRLEQQIGVHAQVTAKNSASQEAADQLHQALQTANDMEVLYLDTQRKFAEMQTQFHEKETEYEAQIHTQQLNFQQQLDVETGEKRRLAKELNELKDKYDRLEKDHAEGDTLVQVMNERQAKRETELRQSLQEAWTQLELLGQDPKAIQECSTIKRQLADVEHQLIESHKQNEQNQAKIDSLTEELHKAKEYAQQQDPQQDVEKNLIESQKQNEQAQAKIISLTEELQQAKEYVQQLMDLEKNLLESQKQNEQAQAKIDALTEELHQAKEYAQQPTELHGKDELDNSLNGMCLADELRDAFGDQESFSTFPRSAVRPRKRPSSILSVALAKMDQSTTMLDTSELEIETKKTRFSVHSSSESEYMNEVVHIRQHLVELQTVLVRYEADFEVLSRDKEILNGQLIAAQNELQEIRTLKKTQLDQSTNRCTSRDSLIRDGDRRSTEGFDSSCIMDEQTIGVSHLDMEDMDQSSEDSMLSARENPSLNQSNSLNQSKLTQENEPSSDPHLVEDDSKILQQQLEQKLIESAEKLRILQNEINEKNTALEESSHSLAEAVSTIETLKQSLEKNQTRAESLNEANGQVQLLHNQIETLTDELTTARQSLESVRITARELSEEKALLENQVVETNQLLDGVRKELETVLQQNISLNQASDSNPLEEELNKALDTVKCLRSELELKSNEIISTQDVLQQARSQTEELEQLSFERNNLAQQVERLTSQLEVLEAAVESKNRQLVALQESSEQLSSIQQQALESEREKTLLELNQAQELRMALASASAEIQEFQAKTQELQQLNGQCQADFKDAQAKIDLLEQELQQARSLTTLQESQKDSQAEIDRLQLVLKETSTKLGDLMLSNEQIKLLLEESQKRSLQLEYELDEKTTSLSAITQETAEEKQRFGEQIRLKEEQVQKIESVVEDLRAEKNRVNSLYEDLRSESDETAIRIRELLNELESEVQIRTTVQNLLAQEKSQVELKEKEAIANQERLENQLRSALEQVNLLTQDLKQSTCSLNAARAEVLALEEANLLTRVPKEDLTALETDWRNAMEQVAQLDRSLNEKTALLVAAQQNVESLQARLQNLERDAIVHRSEIATSESNIELLSTKNSSLSKRIDQFQFELETKEEELSHLRAITNKVAELEAKLKFGETEMINLSRAMEQKTHDARMMEEELARISSSQHGREEQFNFLEGKLQERQVELNHVRSSLEAMQTANDHLVSQLSDKENLNSELRRNYESVTERFEMVRNKLESLQSENMTLSSLVQQLQDELDGRQQELNDLRTAANSLHEERELTSQLKQRLAALQADKETAVAHCERLQELRNQLIESYESLQVEVRELKVKLNSSTEARDSLDNLLSQQVSQRDTILQEYQQQKQTLSDTESQLQAVQRQRDEYLTQIKILSDQITDLRSRTASYEASSNHQIQRQLEDALEGLKKELRDARSNIEVITLNFETEEDARKKKIDRLEKELEAMKQQYMKCKEQLRLMRHRVSDEATVNLPKPRVSVSTESASTQTDPISDKGFGFRWQMDQYNADNERLRKKVSEVGDRMEFYKEKLIKYRNLYFQATGQDPNQRPALSNSASQPLDPRASASSKIRESIDGSASSGIDRNQRKSLTPVPTVKQTISSLQEQQHPEVIKPVDKITIPTTTASSTAATAAVPSSRWSGAKKESLTKEEMEKINNCNPS